MFDSLFTDAAATLDDTFGVEALAVLEFGDGTERIVKAIAGPVREAPDATASDGTFDRRERRQELEVKYRRGPQDRPTVTLPTHVRVSRYGPAAWYVDESEQDEHFVTFRLHRFVATRLQRRGAE